VIVEVGIEADHLLNTKPFTDAINTLSEQLANSILSTTLAETERRERLYMMHSCLNELVGILKSRAQAKDNIEMMLNDIEDTDEGIE
jgi:hypothetical protein